MRAKGGVIASIDYYVCDEGSYRLCDNSLIEIMQRPDSQYVMLKSVH